MKVFADILDTVRRCSPVVHCITNYVTVNDCANIVLAAGGSPIMADDEAEVEDVVALAQALVINVGTLNSRTIAAMLKAGRRANRLGRPVVLDPVGAGVSTLRNTALQRLLQEVRFAAIKGNISEIGFLAGEDAKARGVDAQDAFLVTEGSLKAAASMARGLSDSTGAVVVV
ncbi:MAG: hydroxyethylthiazole kinase, partial [Desulfovibrio sp.]|nr:hydroxyethylthiazole kinase [Desulfovibrio sp.]